MPSVAALAAVTARVVPGVSGEGGSSANIGLPQQQAEQVLGKPLYREQFETNYSVK
jgi:hypothetical protein